MKAKHNKGQISLWSCDGSTTLLEQIMSLKVEDIKNANNTESMKDTVDSNNLGKQLELLNNNINNINNSINHLTKVLEEKLSFFSK